MAGYNHMMGMSNNALDAYNIGLIPLSQIKASDLRGTGCTVKFAKWLAKNNHWQPAEWHHSGGNWYNGVNFFDTCELGDIEDLADLRGKFKAEKSKPDDGIRVKGEYAIWGGSRRYPRLTGHEKFTGILRGTWIHLDGGGRKKADGNHIKFEML